MKKLFKFLYSTKFVLILTLLLNIVIFAAITFFFGVFVYYVGGLVTVFILILIIYFSHDSTQYKITWFMLVLLFPVFGSILYIYVKADKSTIKKRKIWRDINEKNESLLENAIDYTAEKGLSDSQKRESYYIEKACHMPLYKNTSIKYLSCGKDYFEALFYELEKAEKFIFIEYFIISQGQIYDKFIEILKRKASCGVEIKILYDDIGCTDRFNDKKTLKKLNACGIETFAFNRVNPLISAFVNYRTHRKIVVIDGKAAFTGGINIGDEYANIATRYGYWKDTGVMLSGEAVKNLTVTFLSNWQFTAKQRFEVKDYFAQAEITDAKGYVQPFESGPLDREPLAKNIMINLINSAKKYIYFSTPYFIIDGEFKLALMLAAKSGVDIRIIFPSVPDKKYIYYLSRSYFSELIGYGVKFYSYIPGFNHAKMLVVDDYTAMVSTINLDFRSLYLHFENGVLMHNTNAVNDIIADFSRMFENDCALITVEGLKKRSLYERLSARLLKAFSVLM